jgi:hypothetical protein
MYKWLSVNGLSLNADKTDVMNINFSDFQGDPFQAFYIDKKFEEVTNINYPGWQLLNIWTGRFILGG